MPALTGILSKYNKPDNLYYLNKMLNCLIYEDNYLWKLYIDKKIFLWLAWTYYKEENSINFPIWNEKKDIYIIFTGTLFISVDELNVLKSKGHKIENSNYNWVIHLYEDDEKAFFEKINGQFAGILVDHRKNVIYLFNDRYGMGRIYYKEVENQIFFSTEAKSLLEIFPDTRSFDPYSLSELLVCGCTLKNNSLFKGISILPPASVWKFEQGLSCEKRRYLHNGYKNDSRLLNRTQKIDEDYYYQIIKSTLRRIIPKYFITGKTIGISLTGGKDTRILLSLAQLENVDIKGYTFCSQYRENRDAKIGSIISKHLNIPFSIIKLSDDFLKSFPDLAEKTIYITDGLMDVSGAPDLYANKIAREIAPIRLTGNYGQEILESYIAFKPSLLSKKFINTELITYLEYAYKIYFEELKNCDRYSFILTKQLPWHHFSRYRLESSQIIMYLPFLDNDLTKIISEIPFEAQISLRNIRNRLLCDDSTILANIETDLGYKCNDESLIRKFKVFLEIFTFKAEYAYNHGMPDWLAFIDYCLKPLHIENFFLGRHKFYHFRVWYRDKLADYLKEVLLDRKALSRWHINKNAVKKLLLRHLRGIENHTYEINQLLTIELIYRKLIEK